MNPHRRKKFREVEQAWGMPFWDFVRWCARDGQSRCRTAELVGYSKEGFLALLKSSDAPDDLPWWRVPKTIRCQPRRDPDQIERARQARLRNPDTIWITYRGETRHGAEWARIMGLSTDIIYNRYHRGIRGDALFAPPMDRSERGRRGLAARKEKAA
jgi:hypothetical protein